MHPAGIEIEVEMEVDVEVEAAGDGEDARDVLVRVRVGIGAAADQVGAPARRPRPAAPPCPGSLISPSCGKTQISQVDAPRRIRARAARTAWKPLQADARVDLDVGAHVHGAVEDRLLQRPAGAGDDVVLGEGRAWRARSRRSLPAACRRR